MATITKPPLLDETGQEIVAVLNEHALSMSDRTGTRIAIALERLSSSCLTQADIVDNLDSDDATAPLSANQGRELKNLLSNIYPIGSLYTSTNSTNPTTYFGGEWMEVTNNPENRYLHSSYTNGPSWWKWYSDGWLEQGGRLVGALTSAAYGTVNLLKEFKDTNYLVLTREGESSTFEGTGADTAGYGENMGVTDGTVRSFRYSITANRHFDWIACGYANPPEQTKWIWQRIV